MVVLAVVPGEDVTERAGVLGGPEALGKRRGPTVNRKLDGTVHSW
jgi:hypothetical protein